MGSPSSTEFCHWFLIKSEVIKLYCDVFGIYCYYILLGKIGSLLVCISPLSAIMMDQKEKFTSLSLRVEFVGRVQTDKTASRRVINGEVQLVYISPENILCNPKYRQMLMSAVYKENLIGIAVDEAHCVKTW